MLKRCEEEHGFAALKLLQYGSWLRAPTPVPQSRGDGNSIRDTYIGSKFGSNDYSGSNTEKEAEVKGLDLFRINHVNETKELEEEME
ncbi:hypothetical protein TorRG33x02_240850, partial [Trema orientale]